MTDKQLKLQVLLSAVDKVTAPLKNITRGSNGMATAMNANRQRIKELERAQRDLASYRGLTDQSRQVGAALTAQQIKTRELAKQMAAAGVPTKALSREYQQAVNATKKLETQHQSLTSRIKPLTAQLTAAGVKTSDFAREEFKLRSNLQNVTRELDKQKDAMARAAAQQRQLTEAKAAYDKRIATAGKLAGTGAKTTATGAAMLYGGARFMGEGLSFDATMSRVQALARLDKDSDEMKALRAQARELGATTSYNAGDAASGQAFLAMAGFTPHAIMAAMPGILDAAKAGGTDIARTADIASNILGGFKLPADQMGKVADILVTAFTTSNTSLEMLGETMKYVGPVAASAGMGLEEAAAMAGLLGNVGIQSSQAGTTLRAMLLRIAAPAGPAAAAMKELGLETRDAAGNVLGITDILGDVAKATEKLGSAERLTFLKDIFGQEAASGISELIDQAGADGLINQINTVRNNSGSSKKTANVMGDNLQGDLAQMSSAFSEVKLSIFDGQNEQLRELAQTVTALIGRVSAWTNNNPELVASIVKVIGAIAALLVVFGTIMTVIAGILVPIAMFQFSLSVLGIKSIGLIPVISKLIGGVLGLGKALLLNPIGIAIAAIVALGAAVWWAWNNIEPFRNVMLGLWDGIKSEWNNALAWAGEFIDGFKAALEAGDLLSWFGNLALSMAKAFLDYSPIGAIYSAINSLFDMGLPQRFSDFGGALMEGIGAGIASKLQSLQDDILGVAESVKGWFKGVLGINSPSRVFAEYGVNTLQGFENGIDAEKDTALRKVRNFATEASAAGSGILASDSAIALDHRPPLRPANYSHAIAGMGNTYNFYIIPPAGTDPHAIAHEVDRILRQREAEQQRQQRGALSDSYSM